MTNPSVRDIGKFFTEIRKEQVKVLRKEVKNLHKVIVASTPVDTGLLKKSYRKKNMGNVVRISNVQEYSHLIMWVGRVRPGVGSLQLPNGIKPTILKWMSGNEGDPFFVFDNSTNTSL